jgi:YD repeat-containing protein
VYFVQRNDQARIYRIGPDSVIRTFAGNGVWGSAGDGGQARQAQLAGVGSLAFGPDGSLYIGQYDWTTSSTFNNRVRRVTPDGVIRLVAGGGSYGADGVPATNLAFFKVQSLAVSNEGVVSIGDHNIVYQVTPDGIIHYVAGDYTTQAFTGDKGPSLKAGMSTITGLAYMTDGSLLIYDADHHRIRKMAAPMPGFGGGAFLVASENGAEMYTFDVSGRHLKTLDARTGEIIYEFGYDGAGRTATLKERNAQITTIERAPDGTLQAIVGPNGQRTTFRLDANQNLRAVVRLGADSLAFSFSAEGALQSVTAPDGTMTAGATYDSAGALLSRTTANLGTIKYVPATGTSSSSISITDATGAAASIVYRQLPSAVRETRSTVFSGAQVVQSVSPDGTRSTTYPNGMKEAISEAGDPQYQLQAALTTTVVTTPSGLSRTVRLSRGVAGSDLSNPFDVFSSTDSVTVNGRTTIARTDPVEGVLDITGPGGKSVHIDLDDSGRPVSVTEPGRAPMAVSFDALGRLSTITTGTRVSSVTYNAQGHTETRTDPEGRVERFSYDAANRLKTRQFPGGRTLSYTYDAAGHLSSITPSGRPATLFAVNAAGRVERYEPFSNGDGFGRLLTTYDSTGREVLYRRADGRERSMLYAPASPDFSIVTSDGDTARFNHSATTLALTSVIYTRGASVTYSNDGALVTGRTWAGPVVGTASYRYDSD